MKPSSLAFLPLACPLVAFVFGIYSGDYCGLFLSLESFGLCLAVVLAGYVLVHTNCRHKVRCIIKYALLLVLLGTVGVACIRSTDDYWDSDHYAKGMEAQNNFVVKVLEKTSFGLVVKVVRMNERAASGHLLVVGTKLEVIPHLHYLRLNGRPEGIEGPKNPSAFDFRTYCKRLGFSYKLKPTYEPTLLIKENGLNLLARIHTLRAGLLEKLDQYLSDERLSAVAKAMLLGDRTALRGDLKESYQDAGIIHVLAISGLHLGIVYLALLSLWNLLPAHFCDRKRFRTAIVLLLLWIFVVLSGCSSSAVRAATMFSFFEIAGLVGRGKYSINTLCASALFMLLINPQLIFTVGFQLSYLAVLGILILQKPIEALVSVENKVLKGCWKLMSLSLAAQVFTLPLTLFYFHQFPMLFAVTSFLAVPLTAMVVQIGLLSLALHSVPFIGGALLVLLEASLSLINLIATDLGGSFDSVIRNIWVSPSHCLLWFSVMISLTWLIKSRSEKAGIFVLSSALLLQVASLIEERDCTNQRFFICYFVEGSSYGAYVEHTSALKLMPETLAAYQEERSSAGHFLRHRIVKDTTIHLLGDTGKNGYMQTIEMGETRCCILQDSLLQSEQVRSCDIIWVNGAAARIDESVLAAGKTIIVDGSLTEDESLAFQNLHQNRFANVHDVRRDGALTIDLKSLP